MEKSHSQVNQTQIKELTQMSTQNNVNETMKVDRNAQNHSPTKTLLSGFLLSLLVGAVACSPSDASPNGSIANGANAMAEQADADRIEASDPVKCQFFPGIPVARAAFGATSASPADQSPR
jgi:hypothetical protein